MSWHKSISNWLEVSLAKRTACEAVRHLQVFAFLQQSRGDLGVVFKLSELELSDFLQQAGTPWASTLQHSPRLTSVADADRSEVPKSTAAVPRLQQQKLGPKATVIVRSKTTSQRNIETRMDLEKTSRAPSPNTALQMESYTIELVESRAKSASFQGFFKTFSPWDLPVLPPC